MPKPLVVKGDPVDGTDKHDVKGTFPPPPPVPPTYEGKGDYAYKGEVTQDVSDFVTVGGEPLALVTSGSKLRSDGTLDHQPMRGSSFAPPGPLPSSLQFVPPTDVGAGQPGEKAGSGLLTVDGDRALLDGDPFDTCGIPGGKASSTVAAKHQTFVTCSE